MRFPFYQSPEEEEVSDLPGGGWNQELADRSQNPMDIMRLISTLGLGNQSQEPNPMSRYTEHLGAMPNPADTKPSIGRKLLGGLVGAFQGADAGSNAINARYRNNLQDWGTKGAALREDANIYEQRQRRDVGYLTKMIELQQDELERGRKEKSDRDRSSYYERSLDEKRLRTGAAEKSAEASMIRAKRPQQMRDRVSKGPSPRMQSDADRLAIRELIRENPDYEKYIEEDDKGNSRIVSPKGGWFSDVSKEETQGYKSFIEAIKQKKQQILSMYSNENNEDNDDFLIEEEE